LQSRRVDDEVAKNALEEAVRRVASIAIVHETLSNSSTESVAFDEVYDRIVHNAIELSTHKIHVKKVGTFGCMSIFSFNGNKIITTSGGGMLTSNNKGYIEIASHLATQAREPLPYYYHKKIGYNYRMSNVLSAIGRGQLQVLDKKIEKKRKIYEKYKNLLSDMSGITFVDEPAWSKGIRWLTCVLVEGKIFGSTCEDIRLELEKNNVESRPIWKPLHTQPIFSNCEKIGGEVSEKIFEDGLCLPSGTNLTDREIEKVCRIIKKCHKK
jgi:pyridoxal phosphate-dependent aminotransferase EpsN